MLQIGTSQAGSEIACPKCKQNVIVPPNSAPRAEELYRLFKQQQQVKQQQQANPPQTAPPLAPSSPAPTSQVPSSPAPPPSKPADKSPNKPPDKPVAPPTGTPSVPAPKKSPAKRRQLLADAVENADEAEFSEWLDEVWSNIDVPNINIPGKQESNRSAVPSPEKKIALENAPVIKLKQQQLKVLLLKISLGFGILAGIVLGAVLYAVLTQSPMVSGQQGQQGDGQHEVSIIVHFQNEDGIRQPDADAAVICLPQHKKIVPLLMFHGLLPGQDPNEETIARIAEYGGIYARTDIKGQVSFPYRPGIPYLLIVISAHHKGMANIPLPEITEFFSDPDSLGNNAFRMKKYTWEGGKPELEWDF